MVGKRGQFYILAAVIITSVLLSLAVVYNSVYSQPEPARFYDLSGELKSESARVIDYGVYKQEDVSKLMQNFSQIAAKSIIDKYPGVGFVFIYGDKDDLVVENYAEDESYFEIANQSDVLEGGGSEFESIIRLDFEGADFSTRIDQELRHYKEHAWKAKIQNPGSENIKVKINKQDYHFSVKENQQFFMVLLKTDGEDAYVGIR